MRTLKILFIVLSINLTTAQENGRALINTNPKISIIGDFQASYNSIGDRNFDLFLNEVEIAANAAIDPYARADFFFAFHKEEGEDEFHAVLEEAYLTSLGLPAGLQIKAGRFRITFGKTNLIHLHALGYIDIPNVVENYFGEGLIDEGISLNWLIPNPLDFYQDVTFEITRGPAVNRSFTLSDKNNFLYTGHLKNFWDLSDNSTLEFGLSAAIGNNNFSRSTKLAGVDITYKWKPLQFNTYQSFELQSEWLWSNRQITSSENIKSIGGYLYTSLQVAKRWFLGNRFDYSNHPDDDTFIERGISGIAGWYATEFQKIELQLKHTTSNGFDPYNQLMLRSVFVIGAHGAHQY